MTKSLDLHNAEIRTASVEIRALTISGKQVTLAVFRQLREEPLIAEDATLNGVPWGTVNYHPDKCGDDPEHLHVVWQRGNELLRARVNPPFRAWHRCRAAKAFAEAAAAEGLTRPASRREWGLDYWYVFSDSKERHPVHFQYRGVMFYTTLSKAAYEVASRPYIPHPDALRQPDVTAADILPHLPAEQYLATWSELHELPQLFIAA